MSDPNTPARPTPEAPATPAPEPADKTTPDAKPADDTATAAETTTELAPVSGSGKAADEAGPADPAAGKVPASAATATTGAATATATASVTAKKKWWQRTDASDSGVKKKWWQRIRLRGPWLTVGVALVAITVLALLGYVWGLGPLNRLNTARGITPPAKLAGLDRITDQEIRGQLQLDQTRDALSRINDGKQATVEAYGTIDGNRMFVVIALRGKVDINKTVADSGATPDKVKKVGSSTCVESTGNLPTQCYRGSNTLTVIAQSANDGVAVDQVAPVAEEAFDAMK
ncbi:hypothetical protein [Kribbella sp. NBC_00359]|uniref:hypothetical protein n=1 Tax=Kribbella sp. NBC_00359 TaxID=2975966 RepID=UPI002E214FF6